MKWLSFRKKTQAFTIVELIVVVVVIGILAAVSIVSYGAVQKTANDKAVLSDIDSLDGIETHYSITHSNVPKAWYSGSGTDADLQFQPSQGTVIDVVVTGNEYCIRGYNTKGTRNTLAMAYTKESTLGTCDSTIASTIAQSNTPNFASLTWTTRTSAGARFWTGVASSADGAKLIAVADNDYIYTSTDSGANWTQRTGPGVKKWTGAASSADGTKLVAVASNNYVYTSTDSGANWTLRTTSTSGGPNYLKQVSSSADGTKLAIAGVGPQSRFIYTSTNSGVSWTQNSLTSSIQWDSIAVSGDGSKLITGEEDGLVYTSLNFGTSWTKRDVVGSNAIGDWYGFGVSSDGTKLLAANYFTGGEYRGGYVYTSTDSGATWTKRPSIGVHYWNAVASSTDGQKLIVSGSDTNGVYTSSDGGVNWTKRDGPSSDYVSSGLASSADGNKLISTGTIKNGVSSVYLVTGVFNQ